MHGNSQATISTSTVNELVYKTFAEEIVDWPSLFPSRSITVDESLDASFLLANATALMHDAA